MRHPTLRIVALALGALSVGPAGLVGPRAARAQDKDAVEKDVSKAFQKSLDTIGNESAPLAERLHAIQHCAGLTATDSAANRKDEFRKALDALLRTLGSKQPRPDDAEKLAAKALQTISSYFTSFPDLAKLAAPFLKGPGQVDTRVAVFAAAERAGAPGLGPDLVAFIQQPVEPGKAGKDARNKLDPLVVRATWGLGGNEAVEVLSQVLNKSPNPMAKRKAIAALGDFVIRRKPSDYNRQTIINVLKEASKAKATMAPFGDIAAITLLRLNSFDGMPAVFERVGSKGPQKADYQAVCRAAQKPEGFAGVTPEAFEETDRAVRDDAVNAAKEWWATAQKSTPEAIAMEALAAEGLAVPKNPAGKDYLGALIDGLGARNYPLRYAVLDIFVQKTGRTDVAIRFRKLHEEGSASSTKIDVDSDVDSTMEEDPDRLGKLKSQQEETARKLHAAWDKVKDKATYDGAVWNAPWEPETTGVKSPKTGK